MRAVPNHYQKSAPPGDKIVLPLVGKIKVAVTSPQRKTLHFWAPFQAASIVPLFAEPLLLLERGNAWAEGFIRLMNDCQ